MPPLTRGSDEGADVDGCSIGTTVTPGSATGCDTFCATFLKLDDMSS